MCQNDTNLSIDFEQLSSALTSSYAKGCLAQAQKLKGVKLKLGNAKDARLINSISKISSIDLKKYSVQGSIAKALESVDLAKIYEEVDRLDALSKLSEGEMLGYEDFIVKATLKYFKDDFFSWVDKPECPTCGTSDNVKAVGSKGPPAPNPDEISVIELYQCGKCNEHVEFPRINSPTRLLETRKGRCGEWVNCFILILRALLESQTRYVWNAEDHVWCEYYSKSLKRWVHLDPCENVFDEPSLYCENWRKKMSWVIGIGDYYVSDLSSKYVTTEEERLAKSSVADEKAVARFIELANASLLIAAWNSFDFVCTNEAEKCNKLYNEVLVIRAQEQKTLKGPSGSKTSLPQGRQTGSAQWTASRGENGGD